MYSAFGRKVFLAKNPNEAGIIINELIAKLDERKPSISEFIAGFEQISYTKHNTKQSSLVRYILQKLSAHQKLAFADDAVNLTIEHIYPQSKIDKLWTPELVGSLGNLIFLTRKDNDELGDEEFSEKVKALKTFTGSVPADVLDAKEWSIDVVQSRTKSLAEMAYNEVWKIK